MRTVSLRPHLKFSSRKCSTNAGKSVDPLSGTHATACPSGPATEVKVPHSCTVSSPAAPPCSTTGELPTEGIARQAAMAPAAKSRNAFPDIRTLLMLSRLYRDRKSTRLNSSHRCISYAVFCLKKKLAKTMLHCRGSLGQRLIEGCNVSCPC